MELQLIVNIITAALARSQVQLHKEITKLLNHLRSQGQGELADKLLEIIQQVPNSEVHIVDMLIDQGKTDWRTGLSDNNYADYWNLLAEKMQPDDATGHDAENMHQRQFKYLVDECGLKPSDYFLDIGVGSLRGTRLIIPYLEKDHFFGFDVSADLVQHARERVASTPEFAEKMPRLEVDDRFRISKLFPGRQFDFMFSKSVLTHLYPGSTWEVLTRARPSIKDGGVFYATIFKDNQAPVYHGDIAKIWYNTGWLAETAEVTGWKMTEIGKTTVGQYMVRFDPI